MINITKFNGTNNQQFLDLLTEASKDARAAGFETAEYLSKLFPEQAPAILQRRDEILRTRISDRTTAESLVTAYFANSNSKELDDREQVTNYINLVRKLDKLDLDPNQPEPLQDEEESRINDLIAPMLKQITKFYGIQHCEFRSNRDSYLDSYRDSYRDLGEVAADLLTFDGPAEENWIVIRRSYGDDKVLIITTRPIPEDQLTNFIELEAVINSSIQ